MMKGESSVVFLLEPDSGRATIEHGSLERRELRDVAELFGAPEAVNCGRPLLSSAHSFPQPETGVERNRSPVTAVSLYRIYHGSVVDGPGRRSVVQFAGCSIGCEGCYVPQTHDASGGTQVSVEAIVGEVVSEKYRHDGVTILGGEPFDQPDALAGLVAALKTEGLHVVLYTGFEIEHLRSIGSLAVDFVLANADVLIDGPYRCGLVAGGLEYRGSPNQRIIDLKRGTIVADR